MQSAISVGVDTVVLAERFVSLIDRQSQWAIELTGVAANMVFAGFKLPLVRTIGLGLAMLVACMAILVFNVTYRSRQAYVKGETAFEKGGYTRAIRQYERAIKWYTPLSRTVQQSVERLWLIATEAEGRSEPLLALSAYRALRASLYAIQSVYQPYQNWIPQCEARIAGLMADTMEPTSTPQASRQAHRVRFAQMLQGKSSPHLGGALLVELGFLSWIGATIGLIWHAEVGHDQWTWRYGKWWGSGIGLGFAVWILGMLYA